MNWLRTAASAYSNVVSDPEWPKYEILESNKSYEKRRYDAFTCVAFTFLAKSGDEPVMSNLWKLVKYTQGGNVDGKHLKITLPIMVKIRPSMNETQENQFTLMLVLGKENHLKQPPVPNVDGVFIQEHPGQILYARRFGGFAKEADWKRESESILEHCKDLPIDRDHVISATYDLPTKLLNRHNEVLVGEVLPNLDESEVATV